MGDMGLVLDCNDPGGLAPFWAGALGYVNVGAVDNYVLLMPDNKPGPKLLLQKVPEGKAGKNRMHIDLDVPDIEAEAVRLEAIGARRIETVPRSEYGHSWILMADPEGNEFCVCDAT